jgi:hypothetical protein
VRFLGAIGPNRDASAELMWKIDFPLDNRHPCAA